MARGRRLTAWLVVSSALTGCALLTSVGDLYVGETAADDDASAETGTTDVLGSVTDTNAIDGGGLADAPVLDSFLQDVATEATDGCGQTGCFDMPPNFSLVAFGATVQGIACPTGFAQPLNTVEGPIVGGGACSCSGCSVTTQPSCANGQILNRYSFDNNSCDQSGATFANTGCGTDGFTGPFPSNNWHRFTPPGPSGGACQAPGSKDATKLSYAAQGHVCQATVVPQCNGQVCAPAITNPSVVACIAAAGDVACPAAFPTKHLLGTSATFNCTSSCTCTLTGRCSGTLNFYASQNCTGGVGFTLPVNDVCNPSNAGGASFGSYQYVPNAPVAVMCSNGGTTTPSSPTLSQITSVCCK